METAYRAVLTAISAGLLQLDNVQFGQFLLYRPAFSGPLLGLLNGCPLEGARMGILLELLFLDFIPVGGVVPPNGLVAAAAGVSCVAAGLPESAAFFLALAAGFLFARVEFALRSARSGWNRRIEAAFSAGDLRLGRWLASAMASEAAATAAYCLLWAVAAAAAARWIDISGPAPALAFAYSLMPWLGLTAMYFRFQTQFLKK